MDLLPLVVGFLFFFATLIGGTTLGILAKGKARWWGALTVAIGLIGLIPILLVAPAVHPTLVSLSGTYEGKYGGGTDVLSLHPNGTFDQRFIDGNGKVYINHGSWNLSTSQYGCVDFGHLLMVVDGFGHPQRPQATNFAGAGTRLFDSSIYFNDDLNISIKRITGPDRKQP